MISIEEAHQKIKQNCKPLDIELRPINKSQGFALGEDLLSPMNLPSFNQSAMDGYALRRTDLDEGRRSFTLVGEIQAGPFINSNFQSGEAVRIFTGAAVPDCADIVIIQEHTQKEEGQVTVLNYSKGQKSNIRLIGEQVAKSSVALDAGHVINASSIGFLSSMGIQEIGVRRHPEIAVITTGNELKSAGSDLLPGEIYESNAIMLSAALKRNGFKTDQDLRLVDDLEKSVEGIKKCLLNSDVLILSGGISVGKYDFVKRALEANGVEEVFYKVDQKPGKPFYFGQKDGKLIFALPGNPASLLTCFYVYVLPALMRLSGIEIDSGPIPAQLKESYQYYGGRPMFLKAFYNKGEVTILEGQASFILKSFAEANALVYLHGEKRMLDIGSEVSYIPIH